MKNNKNKNAKLALSQIFLLLVSIAAFSYAIGSEVGVVNGTEIRFKVGDDINKFYESQKGNIAKRGIANTFEEFQNFAVRNRWASRIDDGFGHTTLPTKFSVEDKLPDIVQTAGVVSATGTPPAVALTPVSPAPASGQADKKDKPILGNDLACVNAGGSCLSVASCVNGKILDNLCLGWDASVKCCIPKKDSQGNEEDNKSPQEKPEDDSAKKLAVAGIGAGIMNRFAERSVDITINGKDYVGKLVAVKGGGYNLIGEDGKVITKIGNNGLFTEKEVTRVNSEGVWSGFGSGFLGNLAEGAVWAGAIFGALNLFGPILGLQPSETQSIANAAAIGLLAGKGLTGAIEQWGSPKALEYASTVGIWGGVAVGVLYFVDNFKKENKKVAIFTCYPWQAPKGGENCELCNEGDLPCSEYQCKSLGQACELLNKGTSEEKCAWVNRNDVNPPTISPLQSALLNDYIYRLQSTGILPPDRGAVVEYEKSTDKCIPAFTPFKFGITTLNNGEGEPAKCKVDKVRKQNFDDMNLFMSDGLFKYNHTFTLSLPGSANLEAEGLEVENGGNYELFIKCQDANGNENIASFVFKYCVDKGPDTTVPLIDSTSITNGLPIQYNRTSMPLDVYVNEPAQCRWSHNDQSYESMGEAGNMDCSRASSAIQPNGQGLYTCQTTLNGLKDRFENKFYFRCKDVAGNENEESYEYKVLGTQPLVMNSASPNNETIKDSTDVVKVTLTAKTSAGYDEGRATCYWSDESETGNAEDATGYIAFLNSDSFQHSQDLSLLGGTSQNPINYNYYIRCVDLGGNADYKTINFNVESDNEAPSVVRASHEENYLKIITDEPSRCVYDTLDCSYAFEDGIKMTTTDDSSHFTDWNIQSNLYVKCEDEFDNQPNPNQCSIIVRGFDFQ